MSIQILDPRTCSSWDDLLLSTPGYSFFHSSAWAKVLAESYGYTPLYFVSPENGRFKVLIPMMEVDSFLTGRRGVSLPFTDYCDPLVDGDVSFQELFSQMVEYGKKRNWKYIELRGGQNLVPGFLFLVPRFLASNEKRAASNDSFSPRSSNLAPGSSSFGVQPSAFRPQSSEAPSPSLEPPTLNLEPVPKVPRSSDLYLGHTLDLRQGEEKIFSSLRDSTRRNIKKAKNQGVEVKISGDSAGVREFYRLNCLTRREHGLPPQPYHFFKKAFEHIISEGFGFITLASRNGEIIAGAVFFHFGDTAIFKYGASDKKFQELRANNLVMWEGIRWLGNKGYSSISFGRTELENKGLRQFKNGWGADEYSINYFKYDLNREVFVSNNKDSERGTRNIFSKRLSQKMPAPVLNLAGSILYRHMG